jgi:hypothetical protein
MKYNGQTKLYQTSDGRIVGHDDPDRAVLVAVPNLDVSPAYEKDVKAYLAAQDAAPEPESAPEPKQPTKQRQPAENK